MKLALIQCDVSSGDVAGNGEKILAMCAKAPDANLCITSIETLTGPYQPCVHKESSFKARCTKALGHIAAKLPEHQALLCGIPKLYAALLWRRQVIPVEQCFQWHNHKICMTLDEESLEVDLALNLVARPFNVGCQAEWEMILGGMARQSQTWCASLNLVGGYDSNIYNGQSCLAAPDGRIVARAKAFKDDCLYVNTQAIAQGRIEPLCVDRQAACWNALILGLKDFIHKAGGQKVILGLSGGMDSALVACVATEALGPENVLGVLMPSQFTSNASVLDASTLAQNLGISTQTIPIEAIKSAFLESLAPAFTTLPAIPKDLTNENLQARIRGVLLMALANRTGAMILNTGNKSEAAMGYCTLYGDTIGAVSVIGDLFKTEVYELAEWYCAQKGRQIIPENIFARPPSAELAPNQKDTDSLPPYNELDAALIELFGNYGGEDEDKLRQLSRRVNCNAFKRRQSPPVLRISGVQPCDMKGA